MASHRKDNGSGSVGVPPRAKLTSAGSSAASSGLNVLSAEYKEALKLLSEETMLKACDLLLSDRDYKQGDGAESEKSNSSSTEKSDLQQLKDFNPKLKFIFTVSPVRHIRDGVVENNRSKARLIEAVHYIDTKFESAYYFPAYELVIDVLRDYRFYDIDMVHPNYPATEFVLEKFAAACIAEESQQLMKEVRKIMIARKHRAFQPGTKAHQQFLLSHFEKTKALQENHAYLNLKEELAYFSQH